MNNQIKTIIFSKNRALQLDCLLRSMRKMLPVDSLDISVLYHVSNLLHDVSYCNLQYDYPNVNLVKEINFKKDLLGIIETFTGRKSNNHTDNIMFITDDTIFIHNDVKSLSMYTDYINSKNEILGLSLRLGYNTVYCYPQKINNRMPEFDHETYNLLSYDWRFCNGDFGYPLDLSSSVYRINDLLPLLKNLEYSNPNSLESVLYYNLNYFIEKNKFRLACFNRSNAFSLPINRVQNIALLNRFGDNPEYNEDELLKVYNSGKRIDLNIFNNLIPNACHMEVKLQYE